jgi:hypothetical protein
VREAVCGTVRASGSGGAMKERWLPVGVLAVALFAINVAARLVVRFGFEDDAEAADRVSLLMLVAVGLASLAAAVLWGRRHPLGRWIADLAAASLVGLLLSIFVGPFLSSTTPFAEGAGEFFKQVWLWAAFVGGGAGLGFMIITMIGVDYRSQSLKRFTQAKLAKPRRPVRR